MTAIEHLLRNLNAMNITHVNADGTTEAMQAVATTGKDGNTVVKFAKKSEKYVIFALNEFGTCFWNGRRWLADATDKNIQLYSNAAYAINKAIELRRRHSASPTPIRVYSVDPDTPKQFKHCCCNL